jgi:hypothetical protein
VTHQTEYVRPPRFTTEAAEVACPCPRSFRFHALNCPVRPGEYQTAYVERLERSNRKMARIGASWMETMDPTESEVAGLAEGLHEGGDVVDSTMPEMTDPVPHLDAAPGTPTDEDVPFCPTCGSTDPAMRLGGLGADLMFNSRDLRCPDQFHDSEKLPPLEPLEMDRRELSNGLVWSVVAIGCGLIGLVSGLAWGWILFR